MRGLWAIRKGFVDTYGNLLGYALASLAWVALVFIPLGLLRAGVLPALLLLLPAPAATLALFHVADPRLAVSRPSGGEVVGFARRQWRRGLVLAAIVGPIIAILVWNLWFYGSGRGGVLGFLVPFWLVLLLLAVVFGLTAFSCGALFPDEPLRRTLRRAAYVVLAAPGAALVVLLGLVILTLIGVVLRFLVVPAVMFLPALIAATFNRLALRVMDVPVVDPNAPTDEAAQERDRRPGKDRRWGRG